MTMSMDGMSRILGDSGGFWMPPRASTVAGDVDWLFYFILWISVFFFVLILVLLVYFAWKYRYREGQPVGDAPSHNTALELTWTFIPTLLVVIIFYYGFKGFMGLAVAPPDPYEIVVMAHMWSFNFSYPNGHIDDQLHIPADTPIQFTLNSADVIHGFYVPAFRVKKDIVPDRYNKIWVQALPVKAGDPQTYDIYCTQYCGQGHSTMRSSVIVHEPNEFQAWLEKADLVNMSPPEHGHKIWETRGCNGCHSIDGSIIRAPSWKELFGFEQHFQDGGSQMADEDYLHLVITNANIHPIVGFQPVMPTTVGLLKPQDVNDVIAYIKTLSSKYHPALPKPTTAPLASPATKPAG